MIQRRLNLTLGEVNRWLKSLELLHDSVAYKSAKAEQAYKRTKRDLGRLKHLIQYEAHPCGDPSCDMCRSVKTKGTR